MKKNISADNYRYDQEGILQAQIIQKCELAFMYNLTPQQFRQNIRLLVKITSNRRSYSVNEVQAIFDKYGIVTKTDVENAIPRITDYYNNIRARDLANWEAKNKKFRT